MPVTIKDNVEVRGQRTPNGVAGLAHIVAKDDAPIVRRLVDAGAVWWAAPTRPSSRCAHDEQRALRADAEPVGRTHLVRRILGRRRGGGGDRHLRLGHGNDVAGSIRFPALHCGIAGFKPTTPAEAPLASVQGPLARRIGDIRSRVRRRCSRRARARQRYGRRPGRHAIGLIAAIPGMPIARRSRGRCATPAALDQAGYVVEPIEAPDIVASGELWLRFLMTDLQQLVVPVARRLGSEQINWYFDAWVNGLPPFTEAQAFRDAVAARNAMLAEWARCWRRIPWCCCRSGRIRCSRWTRTSAAPSTCATCCAATRRARPMNLLGLPSVVVPTGLGDGCRPASSSSRRRTARIAPGCGGRRRSVLGTLAEQLWRGQSPS